MNHGLKGFPKNRIWTRFNTGMLLLRPIPEPDSSPIVFTFLKMLVYTYLIMQFIGFVYLVYPRVAIEARLYETRYYCFLHFVVFIFLLRQISPCNMIIFHQIFYLSLSFANEVWVGNINVGRPSVRPSVHSTCERDILRTLSNFKI